MKGLMKVLKKKYKLFSKVMHGKVQILCVLSQSAKITFFHVNCDKFGEGNLRLELDALQFTFVSPQDFVRLRWVDLPGRKFCTF